MLFNLDADYAVPREDYLPAPAMHAGVHEEHAHSAGYTHSGPRTAEAERRQPAVGGVVRQQMDSHTAHVGPHFLCPILRLS